MERHFYFAYGSNLCAQQMSSRCPSSQFNCRAILHDYELCFPIVSPKRQSCGVASVRPKIGSLVEGIVYTINSEDLEKLDGFEDLGTLYERKKIEVENQDELKALDPWIYFALCQSEQDHFPPSDDYLDTILRGAKHHHLSQKYLNHLEQWRQS